MASSELFALPSWVRVGTDCRWWSKSQQTYHPIVVTSIDNQKRRIVVHFKDNQKVWKTVPFSQMGADGPVKPPASVTVSNAPTAWNESGTATPPWYDNLESAEARRPVSFSINNRGEAVPHHPETVKETTENQGDKASSENSRDDEASDEEGATWYEKLREKRKDEASETAPTPAVHQEFNAVDGRALTSQDVQSISGSSRNPGVHDAFGKAAAECANMPFDRKDKPLDSTAPQAVTEVVDEAWIQLETAAGKMYFWNRVHDTTGWVLPKGVKVKWYGTKNGNGRTYYWNDDGETVWNLPPMPCVASEKAGASSATTAAPTGESSTAPEPIPAAEVKAAVTQVRAAPAPDSSPAPQLIPAAEVKAAVTQVCAAPAPETNTAMTAPVGESAASNETVPAPVTVTPPVEVTTQLPTTIKDTPCSTAPALQEQVVQSCPASAAATPSPMAWQMAAQVVALNAKPPLAPPAFSPLSQPLAMPLPMAMVPPLQLPILQPLISPLVACQASLAALSLKPVPPPPPVQDAAQAVTSPCFSKAAGTAPPAKEEKTSVPEVSGNEKSSDTKPKEQVPASSTASKDDSHSDELADCEATRIAKQCTIRAQSLWHRRLKEKGAAAFLWKQALQKAGVAADSSNASIPDFPIADDGKGCMSIYSKLVVELWSHIGKQGQQPWIDRAAKELMSEQAESSLGPAAQADEKKDNVIVQPVVVDSLSTLKPAPEEANVNVSSTDATTPSQTAQVPPVADVSVDANEKTKAVKEPVSASSGDDVTTPLPLNEETPMIPPADEDPAQQAAQAAEPDIETPLPCPQNDELPVPAEESSDEKRQEMPEEEVPFVPERDEVSAPSSSTPSDEKASAPEADLATETETPMLASQLQLEVAMLRSELEAQQRFKAAKAQQNEEPSSGEVSSMVSTRTSESDIAKEEPKKAKAFLPQPISNRSKENRLPQPKAKEDIRSKLSARPALLEQVHPLMVQQQVVQPQPIEANQKISIAEGEDEKTSSKRRKKERSAKENVAPTENDAKNKDSQKEDSSKGKQDLLPRSDDRKTAKVSKESSNCDQSASQKKGSDDAERRVDHLLDGRAVTYEEMLAAHAYRGRTVGQSYWCCLRVCGSSMKADDKKSSEKSKKHSKDKESKSKSKKEENSESQAKTVFEEDTKKEKKKGKSSKEKKSSKSKDAKDEKKRKSKGSKRKSKPANDAAQNDTDSEAKTSKAAPEKAASAAKEDKSKAPARRRLSRLSLPAINAARKRVSLPALKRRPAPAQDAEKKLKSATDNKVIDDEKKAKKAKKEKKEKKEKNRSRFCDSANPGTPKKRSASSKSRGRSRSAGSRAAAQTPETVFKRKTFSMSRDRSRSACASQKASPSKSRARIASKPRSPSRARVSPSKSRSRSRSASSHRKRSRSDKKTKSKSLQQSRQNSEARQRSRSRSGSQKPEERRRSRSRQGRKPLQERVRPALNMFKSAIANVQRAIGSSKDKGETKTQGRQQMFKADSSQKQKASNEEEKMLGQFLSSVRQSAPPGQWQLVQPPPPPPPPPPPVSGRSEPPSTWLGADTKIARSIWRRQPPTTWLGA